MSALFGACFAFPGFRTAQMSRDASKNVSLESKIFPRKSFSLNLQKLEKSAEIYEICRILKNLQKFTKSAETYKHFPLKFRKIFF